MTNPNINRLIGFIILFAGFAVFGIGWVLPYIILKVLLCGAGIAMFIGSLIWDIKKVRCPYCNALLSLKIWYDVKCPYCGERIDN
ncbi:MAG: hypothetical protein IJR45_00815 [Firmicutes bacterium]|nr:hypothetical protein [Bacillota bacterium]